MTGGVCIESASAFLTFVLTVSKSPSYSSRAKNASCAFLFADLETQTRASSFGVLFCVKDPFVTLLKAYVDSNKVTEAFYFQYIKSCYKSIRKNSLVETKIKGR